MRAEVPSLTPMRGIAAVLVVLYHTTATPFSRGYLGVDFFFLLSGFILTHVYAAGFAGSLRQTGRFLWLRLSRIYPTHALTTIVLLPHLGSGTGFSGFDFAMALLLVQVLIPYSVFNNMAWSVSAEWFAYMLFPLLALCLNRLGRLGLFLAWSATLALWGLAYHHGPVPLGLPALGRTLPEFIAGMLLYRMYSARSLPRFWRSDCGFLTAAAAVVVPLVLGAPDPVPVAALPLLMLCAAENAGRVTGILNARPLTLLGEASYSIYLGQAFALILSGAAAETLIGPTVGLHGLQATMVVASIGFGFLLHRCVEQPCRKTMRGWPQAVHFVMQNRRLA